MSAPGPSGRIGLAGVVGNRLDGWPDRDLLRGTIVSLSPALTAGQKAEYASWATLFGPGFYDPRINVNTDPGSNPAVDARKCTVTARSEGPLWHVEHFAWPSNTASPRATAWASTPSARISWNT